MLSAFHSPISMLAKLSSKLPIGSPVRNVAIHKVRLCPAGPLYTNRSQAFCRL